MSCLECGSFDMKDYHLCVKCDDKYAKLGKQASEELKAQKEI